MTNRGGSGITGMVYLPLEDGRKGFRLSRELVSSDAVRAVSQGVDMAVGEVFIGNGLHTTTDETGGGAMRSGSALHRATRPMKFTSFKNFSTPSLIEAGGVILLLFWQYYSKVEADHLMHKYIAILDEFSKWQANNIAEIDVESGDLPNYIWPF